MADAQLVIRTASTDPTSPTSDNSTIVPNVTSQIQTTASDVSQSILDAVQSTGVTNPQTITQALSNYEQTAIQKLTNSVAIGPVMMYYALVGNLSVIERGILGVLGGLNLYNAWSAYSKPSVTTPNVSSPTSTALSGFGSRGEKYMRRTRV